jgi:hypothetical protein
MPMERDPSLIFDPTVNKTVYVAVLLFVAFAALSIFNMIINK